MGRNKLPRIEVNGKEYLVCPICGGPCTEMAYKRHGRCTECSKVVKQGHTIDETKAIRFKQRNSKIEDAKKLAPTVQKKRDINFRNILPNGITIKGNTAKEASILTETYNNYYQLYSHLIEFNSLITPILSAVLESYKITEKIRINDSNEANAIRKDGKLFNKDGSRFIPISLDDRKMLLDMKRREEDEIRKTSKVFDEIKNNRVQQSGNILINEFKKILRFHHEQKQYYMGVGICPDCKKRIILKTEFPTFKNRYEDILRKLIDNVINDGYDETTSKEIMDRVKKRLTDDDFVDTYVAYHTRELEESLV
jgi:hypothetical protein